jgi:hypothetical protein
MAKMLTIQRTGEIAKPLPEFQLHVCEFVCVCVCVCVCVGFVSHIMSKYSCCFLCCIVLALFSLASFGGTYSAR